MRHYKKKQIDPQVYRVTIRFNKASYASMISRQLLPGNTIRDVKRIASPVHLHGMPRGSITPPGNPKP